LTAREPIDDGRPMRRTRATTWLVGWAVLATLLVRPLASAQAPPNIVVIVGDDHGWTDFGFMPSARTVQTSAGARAVNQVVRTPHLDALAAGGVTFRNAHNTASVCVPSLQTALSAAGLHGFQWVATEQALEAELGTIPFRREVQHIRTVPRELGRAGYQSWEGGKMWEGTFRQAGFTHGLATAMGTFYEPVGWDFGRAGWNPAWCGPTAAAGASCPALDPLRDFLDEAQDGPFFVWFAPQLPHAPYDPPQEFQTPFDVLGLATPDDGWPTPGNYFANVMWFDALVGELIDELQVRGLRNDTLIVYFADNGWNHEGFDQAKGKNSLYEMGFRTPLVFNWPGHVPANRAYGDLVSITDLAPTLFAYAGVDTLPEQQGVNLRSRIQGGGTVARTELIGLHEGIGHWARTSTWRYLRFAGDGHQELYRIGTDPLELTDVAAENPSVVSTFAAKVSAWETQRRTPPARAEVSGRALDPTTGAPLVGVQLALDYGRICPWCNGDLVSIVGEDGSFRFGPFPSIPYAPISLEAHARVGAITGLGESPTITSKVPMAISGTHLQVTGTRTGSLGGVHGAQLRGTLKTSSHAPLDDVKIEVKGARGCGSILARVRTQPDGSYRVENLPPATYTITATPGGGYQNVVVPNVVVSTPAVYTRNLVAQPK